MLLSYSEHVYNRGHRGFDVVFGIVRTREYKAYVSDRSMRFIDEVFVLFSAMTDLGIDGFSSIHELIAVAEGILHTLGPGRSSAQRPMMPEAPGAGFVTRRLYDNALYTGPQGYIADVPTGTSVNICSWRRCGCYKVMIFRPGDQDGEGADSFERVIPEICLQQSS